MPTALLIRHAQASFGASDYDVLSELGLAQAEALAAELAARGVVPARLITGSLRRQADTLAPFAAAAGVGVETDGRWDEYAADALLGAYTDSGLRLGGDGAPRTDAGAFQDLLDGALLRWIAGPTPAGIEAWSAFSARVDAALEDSLGGLGAGETAVIVTSGGVISAVCASLLGLRGSGFLSFNRIAINTAITTVVRGRRGTHLVAVNEHGHLRRPDAPALTYR